MIDYNLINAITNNIEKNIFLLKGLSTSESISKGVDFEISKILF